MENFTIQRVVKEDYRSGQSRHEVSIRFADGQQIERAITYFESTERVGLFEKQIDDAALAPLDLETYQAVVAAADSEIEGLVFEVDGVVQEIAIGSWKA